jgi:ABC-type multidrug transport system ATPase subunit
VSSVRTPGEFEWKVPIPTDAPKRSIGYLPNGTPLNPRLTVRQNLEFWGRVHGFDAATRSAQVERVGEGMGLRDLLGRKGTDLSRGQKQRVTIARCLLPDPSVLFLDEPTTGLDPTAAAALRNRLAELANEGRTLCYSTHNLYEAELLADELTVVRNGEVVAQGPEAELSANLRGGGSTSVTLSCDASPDDFAALGVQVTREGGDWRVDLPPDRRVSDLVRELVGRDVAIEGVWPEETSLEDLYRELAGGESND